MTRERRRIARPASPKANRYGDPSDPSWTIRARLRTNPNCRMTVYQYHAKTEDEVRALFAEDPFDGRYEIVEAISDAATVPEVRERRRRA
jgi:hypothetical protein